MNNSTTATVTSTIKLSINDIKPEHIESVYSGRSGCACGCRGTHSDNTITIKKALTRLAKNPATTFQEGKNGFQHLFYTDDGTRLNIIYLKKGFNG